MKKKTKHPTRVVQPRLFAMSTVQRSRKEPFFAAEDLVVFNQVEVKIDENHFRKGVENVEKKL